MLKLFKYSKLPNHTSAISALRTLEKRSLSNLNYYYSHHYPHVINYTHACYYVNDVTHKFVTNSQLDTN